jgi:hypothetical protein
MITEGMRRGNWLNRKGREKPQQLATTLQIFLSSMVVLHFSFDMLTRFKKTNTCPAGCGIDQIINLAR